MKFEFSLNRNLAKRILISCGLLVLINSGFSQAKPIATWHLNGNYNNSVPGDYATLTGPDQWTTGRLGNSDQAADFTGKGKSVRLVLNSNKLKSEDFSLSFWIYFGKKQLQGILVQDKGIVLRTDVGNRGILFTRNAVGKYAKPFSLLKFPVKQWTHIALVWRKNSMNVFVNGKKILSAIEDNSKISRAKKNMTFGNFANWRLFGRMDDIMIFSTALTKDEVEKLQAEMPMLDNSKSAE